MTEAPILLVEDSEDDVLFMKRALQRAGINRTVTVLTNGRDAVNYLASQEGFSDRGANPLPCLIFLDIKLPYMSGLEVLQWKRAQPAVAPIPVVVLSSSDRESDIGSAYRYGANSYLVKPASFERLTEMLALTTKYWLELTRLPPECYGRTTPNHSG